MHVVHRSPHDRVSVSIIRRGNTNYVIVIIQIKRSFRLGLTRRQGGTTAIAFPLTVYLSDHHFRNTSLTALLYSRSSYVHVPYTEVTYKSADMMYVPDTMSSQVVQFNVFPCHVDTGVAILINRHTCTRYCENVPVYNERRSLLFKDFAVNRTLP